MAKKDKSEGKSLAKAVVPAASMADLDREPTEQESRLLEGYFSEDALTAPKIKSCRREDGALRAQIEASGSTDAAIVHAQHRKAFGSQDDDFLNMRMLDIASAVCDTEQLNAGNNQALNGTVAAMYGIKPRDELEALLVTQMMATHSAAITILQRLKTCDTIRQQDSASNQANKLMRTFTTQMEALNRYRGKGQQKMTVEHVHVHDGGQAIVGQVAQGGGATEKDRGQSHAIGYAPGETLRSEDKKKDAVPVTGDAKR